jgi:PIN domain nuclease of toxin-antitoxin system
MIAYVIDSSALLRFVDNEAGSGRVEEILMAGVSGKAGVNMSAVQWGEVAGKLRVHHGTRQETRILSELLPSEVEIVAVTGDRAVRAAHLKVDRKIAYADAFALELAMESVDHVLVTADYGFKAVDDLARIEFLPAK